MRNPFKRGTRIIPNQDFLDGATRYLKGETYRVGSALAAYFRSNDWLEGDESPSPRSTALDIQDSVLGHEGGL